VREKHQSGSTGLLWTLTVSSVAADRRGSKRKVRGIRISHQHFSARTVGISKLSRNRHITCDRGWFCDPAHRRSRPGNASGPTRAVSLPHAGPVQIAAELRKRIRPAVPAAFFDGAQHLTPSPSTKWAVQKRMFAPKKFSEPKKYRHQKPKNRTQNSKK